MLRRTTVETGLHSPLRWWGPTTESYDWCLQMKPRDSSQLAAFSIGIRDFSFPSSAWERHFPEAPLPLDWRASKRHPSSIRSPSTST